MIRPLKQTWIWIALTLAVTLATAPPSALAQKTDASENQKKEADDAENKPDREDTAQELVETKHSVFIVGTEIRYTATAGTILLKKNDGEPKANFFFIAYTKDGGDDLTKRPVTFAFNGGPGSSSVWLHLGTLGPRRVHLKEDGTPYPPPYRLVDNEYSILDLTDLVFIDPISTGFSRAAEEESPKQFHGVQEDVESVGEFIRLYTTQFKRWSSPKFLAGESYGTTRAAGLAGHLHHRHGMYVNGVLLISSILDFQTIRFDRGNDMPYILFLPTYTASAWHHKKLPADLQARELTSVLDEVREFALGEYAAAMIRGDLLSESDKKTLAAKVARYTGLSVDYVERCNLRIQISRFCKELLRDEGRTLGRYDSRYTGIDRDTAGATPEYDPSYSAVQGLFTGTLNHYIRTELEYESDLVYEILTGQVHPWNYGAFQNRYVNVADTLREAMTQNPYLQVFVANGVYDLATPFLATEYTFNHLDLDASLRAHITMDEYAAGHMMYLHHPSLQKLKKDMAIFFEKTIAQR